jgi:hypothetical protein
MAKNSITDYSKTASLNTDIQSVDIDEGCLPSGINNAIRELMADLAAMNDGTVSLTSPSFAAATIAGDLTVDTSTLKVDSTNNRVGIGTSSPTDAQLDVRGTAGVKIGDGTCTLELLGRGDLGYAIVGTDTNHPMLFRTNNTERMRIDSSGNLLVGKTSADNNTNGVILRPSNYATFTNTSSRAIIANRKTSDGDIIEFRKDNTTVGSIGVEGGDNFYITDNNNTGLNMKSGLIIPCNTNGSTRDNAIDLGASGGRFKSLYLSSDLVLGAADGYVFGNTNGVNIRASSGKSTIFDTAGSERMRIDSSGNVLVGTTSNAPTTTAGINLGANNKLHATRSGGTSGYFNRLSSDGGIVEFAKDGTTVGSIGVYEGANDYLIIGDSDTGLLFLDVAGSAILPWGISNNSVEDNSIDLGNSTARFDDIYATNGTIQTSDQNEKQDIEALSEAEQRVAVAAKGLLRKFRWIDSVEEKGDDARIHFGIIAQDLQAAFEAEGLDAGRYAMFINSTWTDEETGEERSRMGVRYNQLLAFIIAAI